MPTMFTLLFLGGLLWMGQFIWFPDGGKLLALFTTDPSSSVAKRDRWAIDLYRATFAPDTGYRWVPRWQVVSGWVSWGCVLLMAVSVSLLLAGLLPKDVVVSWSLLGVMLVYLLSMVALLFLLALETWMLQRRGVSLRYRVRKQQWLATHAAPGFVFPSGRLPWWFWLDSGISDSIVRLVVFLGGFVASVAALLYFSRITSPGVMPVRDFWEDFLFWAYAVLWLPIPVTIWLSHLDWARHNREVLLVWAGIERQSHCGAS